MKVVARDWIHASEEKLWETFNFPEFTITVIFDDGGIETTGREFIFSWYFWEFHRRYPKTPMLMRHHKGSEYLNQNTTLQLLSHTQFDCHDVYSDAVDIEDLSKLSYDVTQSFYNTMTYALEEYVMSVDALDYIEILDNPRVQAANANVKPNEKSIAEAGRKIIDTLRDPVEFPDNPVALNVRGDLSSPGQVKQTFGPRGYLTDLDSNIFRNPILVGYAEGFRLLHDSALDSCSAKKALAYQKSPLQKTEYFNREMQLNTSIVRRIYHGDCGTNEYIPWIVKSKDLPALSGMHYFGDDHKLYRISEANEELIGSRIRLRSPLTCHRSAVDQYGICSVCFGELAKSIPKRTILGQAITAALCEMISQNVLSTKHLDGSSEVDPIYISAHDKRFIRIGRSISHIAVSRELRTANVSITVQRHEAQNLPDISTRRDIEDFSLDRISNIKTVLFKIETEDEIAYETVNIAMGSRRGSFTREFLLYIRENGYDIDDNMNYCISLNNWDFEESVFQLPMKHLNMLEFMKEVEKVIKVNDDARRKFSVDYNDPANLAKLLEDFQELITSKFHMHLSVLSTILYSTMVRSRSGKDYRLPVPGSNRDIEKYAQTMSLRSLSAKLAYQGHGTVLPDIQSFVIKQRPSHPFDHILVDLPDDFYEEDRLQQIPSTALSY